MSDSEGPWISDQCEGIGDVADHDRCEDPTDCACPCHEGDEEGGA